MSPEFFSDSLVLTGKIFGSLVLTGRISGSLVLTGRISGSLVLTGCLLSGAFGLGLLSLPRFLTFGVLFIALSWGLTIRFAPASLLKGFVKLKDFKPVHEQRLITYKMVQTFK